VDTLVVWSVALVALAGLATMVWRLVRPLRRVARKVDEFMDDWNGVPARRGVSARPGVMERLDQIEHTVGLVAHEVKPNGGASMRDAINRVDERTARIAPDDETDTEPS
jgi:hypothetical protein